MQTITLAPTEAPRTDLEVARLHVPPDFFEGKTLGDYCRVMFYAGRVITGAVMDTVDKIASDFARYVNEPEIPAKPEAKLRNQANSHIWVEELFGDDDRLVNDLGRLGYYIGITALDGVESIGNKAWGKVSKFERPTLRKILVWPFQTIGRVARGTVAIPGKMSSLMSDRIPSDPVLARQDHSPGVDIRINTYGPN